MSKVFLFDLDGVVIRPRHCYFSEKYSEDYKIPLEKIMPFFKTEFKLALTGKVDLKEILPKYLRDWEWKKSLNEFLAYWFESEKEIDTNVLEAIRKIRKRGIKCYLVSQNERNRKDYVLDSLGLKKEFDGSIFTCDVGLEKSDSKFFEKVIKIIGVKSKDAVFWESDSKYTEVAKSVGIDAKVYSSFKDFKKQVL
jgi:putative hydrolase of the HAD superfamily